MTEARKTTIMSPGEPIAIVRLDDLSEAVSITKALLDGGIKALEFTLTNERALNAITEVRERLGTDAMVGAGTVLDGESAQAAIRHGAQFLVTPVLRQDVVDSGKEGGVPVVCGAFSATEILDAWQGGAELVKIFPIRDLGPTYIKDMLGPLPQVKMVPTGGVNLENCAAFLEAGAYTVAVGSSLVDENAISRRDWRILSNLAASYVKACESVAADS